MILTLLHLAIDITALALTVLLVRSHKRNVYLQNLLADERSARFAVEKQIGDVVMAIEPILQKTAWSMGGLAHYTVRAEEVRRNDIVDRVRRDLSKFNLPDPTKGGSYEDLQHLNKTDLKPGERL